MQKYRTLAAHNAPCNEYYYKFQDCQYEHPFGKFFGKCTDFEKQMQVCIRKQLQLNREKNHQISKEKFKKMQSKKEEQTNNSD
ncbi:COX assembly mitochondrial protein 2 homolog isoform X2 [Megalopta genalis]|uniref:COX assembly mitochondrial protein 2 homolog isoform X2 n=1 Tax=Megalopta genalis TaxID=115081 RepID=UPI003FD5B643